MARTAHYLSRQNGGSIPKSVVCCAVSGVPGRGGAWACEHWSRDNDSVSDIGGMHGLDADTFWSLMKWHLMEHRGAWLVFLGASEQLTKLGFWDQLEETKWKVADHDEKKDTEDKGGRNKPWQGFVVIQDPPTIIKCRPEKGKGVLTIIDARNYGVEGWGSIGFEGAESTCGVVESAQKALKLRDFVAGWIATVKEYRLGSLKMTAASQAMHAYRHRFLRHMVLSHNDYQVLGHERQAVYAGRNESLVMGKVPGPVYHLDFTAFYPSVAANESMPARLAGHTLGVKPHPSELQSRGFLVISEVTLETDRPYYPVRYSKARHYKCDRNGVALQPLVRAQEGDLLFPVGRFATVLCGPELQVAMDRGHVKRVHATAWYEPAELFTEWGNAMIALQSEARKRFGKAGSECIKRLRNALFGKFAQWAWGWVDCPGKGNVYPYETWWGLDPKGEKSVRYRSIAWHVQHERMEGEGVDSCPAISGWVYSLARVRLLACLIKAGWPNVYYMDSDSLWTNHQGYSALMSGGWIADGKAGSLSLVDTHEWVRFNGLKSYDTPKGSTHVGVPENATGDSQAGYRYATPETVAAVLSQHRAPEPVDIQRKMTPARVYRHGIVCLNGRVKPYELWED